MIIFLLIALFCVSDTFADHACTREGGECRWTSSGCSGGQFRPTVICDGPANRQCCLKDGQCTSAGGDCRWTSSGCSGGQFRPNVICDGPANRQCCLKDGQCTSAGGECRWISSGCSGGQFRPNVICDGPANRQCCLKGPDKDRQCISAGGECRWTTSGCSGGHFRPDVLCDGPANRQCCLPDGTVTGEIVGASCLRCICQTEGCEGQVGKCGWDVNSDSCGPYQIKEAYWKDCGKPGRSWRECAKQMACSERCVQAYMRRYATICTRGRTPTCEDFAKIHNGGPYGCRHNLASYWGKVSRCCGGRC